MGRKSPLPTTSSAHPERRVKRKKSTFAAGNPIKNNGRTLYTYPLLCQALFVLRLLLYCGDEVQGRISGGSSKGDGDAEGLSGG
jgi:hypothetical protein